MKYKLLLLFILISIATFSCLTIKQRFSSEQINDKIKADFFIKADRDGNLFGELTSNIISPCYFFGDIKIDQTGDIFFYINSLKFFTNWHNGWNSGTQMATGTLIFQVQNDKYLCEVVDEIRLWEVIKGESRYFDDIYKGDDGISNIKNKIDRIVETTNFLHDKYPNQYFTNFKEFDKTNPSFKSVVRKKLFPEIFDLVNLYSKDQSPDYQIKDYENDLSLKFTIIWNKKYTREVFPKHLWEIRDSGTLYKDFEEVSPLFFSYYNIDFFISEIIPSVEIKLSN